MQLAYKAAVLRGEEAAVLLGGRELPERLSIPEAVSLDGRMLPVREIAAHAFDGDGQLASVFIPESVHSLRPFAFYNCSALRYLSLTEQVQDYYDGVIKQCSALSLIELHCEKSGRLQLLKEMLGDNDSRLRFRIYLPDGCCTLSFPPYLDNFLEDTMSRAIHESIEGSGYEYRQTVSRAGIDLWAYDRLFSRVVHDDPRSARHIAVDRLHYPYHLSGQAADRYRDYIAAEGEGILRQLIAEGWLAQRDPGGREPGESMAAIQFLCAERLLSVAAIQAVLPHCAERRLTELTAVLMNGTAQTQQAEPESFEL